MYYIWREDNMVLAFIGSGTQQAFVPFGTRAAAYFGLQTAILLASPQEGKPRMFVIALGEYPPTTVEVQK